MQSLVTDQQHQGVELGEGLYYLVGLVYLIVLQQPTGFPHGVLQHVLTTHLDEPEVLTQEYLLLVDLVSQQVAHGQLQMHVGLPQHLSLGLMEHFHGQSVAIGEQVFLEIGVLYLLLVLLETEVSEESTHDYVVSMESLQYLYLDYVGEEGLESGGVVVTVDVQDGEQEVEVVVLVVVYLVTHDLHIDVHYLLVVGVEQGGVVPIDESDQLLGQHPGELHPCLETLHVARL